MEAKLIKTGNEYLLKDLKGEVLAITSGSKEGRMLSLKNCQAIERGYDLDELAKKFRDETIMNSSFISDETSFKEGFQKALEVNADKRFTLEDMMNCWNTALKFQDHKETLGEHIQSLKQTEWNVEVEMICPHPMDTYRCGLQYGCDGDGCNHPEQVPYLDPDGCLILKRK
jgi:hypothetical protein